LFLEAFEPRDSQCAALVKAAQKLSSGGAFGVVVNGDLGLSFLVGLQQRDAHVVVVPGKEASAEFAAGLRVLYPTVRSDIKPVAWFTDGPLSTMPSVAASLPVYNLVGGVRVCAVGPGQLFLSQACYRASATANPMYEVVAPHRVRRRFVCSNVDVVSTTSRGTLLAKPAPFPLQVLKWLFATILLFSLLTGSPVLVGIFLLPFLVVRCLAKTRRVFVPSAANPQPKPLTKDEEMYVQKLTGSLLASSANVLSAAISSGNEQVLVDYAFTRATAHAPVGILGLDITVTRAAQLSEEAVRRFFAAATDQARAVEGARSSFRRMMEARGWKEDVAVEVPLAVPRLSFFRRLFRRKPPTASGDVVGPALPAGQKGH